MDFDEAARHLTTVGARFSQEHEPTSPRCSPGRCPASGAGRIGTSKDAGPADLSAGWCARFERPAAYASAAPSHGLTV